MKSSTAVRKTAAASSRKRPPSRGAARRLDETANNLLRINDIKTEVGQQVEPLRLQSEKTLKFRELDGELQKVHLTQAVNRIDNIETVRQKVRAEKEEAQNDLAAKTAEKAKQDAECAGLQHELDSLNDTVAHMKEGIAAKEKELGGVKAESDVLEERVKQYGTQVERLTKSNAKLDEEIRQWDGQLQVLAGEYDKLETAGKEAERQAVGFEEEKAQETNARDDARQ